MDIEEIIKENQLNKVWYSTRHGDVINRRKFESMVESYANQGLDAISLGSNSLEISKQGFDYIKKSKFVIYARKVDTLSDTSIKEYSYFILQHPQYASSYIQSDALICLPLGVDIDRDDYTVVNTYEELQEYRSKVNKWVDKVVEEIKAEKKAKDDAEAKRAESEGCAISRLLDKIIRRALRRWEKCCNFQVKK